MIHLAFFITHFWHFFYLPLHGPWYGGAVWGNVFVVPIAAFLGWSWSRTKFWPLRPIKHGIEHLHTKVDSLHDKHDMLHKRHDEHAQSLDELHEKVNALMKHLDKHSGGS